uniref:Small integral membrane protein 4 n=1 Tax=Anser cygnoides TaxID=8845 RepID=A0A8B9D496_ANSCY|nr:small integral membrane protein 4 isoform X1 [Anser cygnoides]
MLVSGRVRRLLRRVPGRQRFGAYRFLPFFFLLGGAMEWVMIHVRVGKETFSAKLTATKTAPEGLGVLRFFHLTLLRHTCVAVKADDVYRRKRSERQYKARMDKSEF